MKKSETASLKPCAHCGGKAKVDEFDAHVGGTEIMISCQDCTASVFAESKMIAYVKWNRRSGPSLDQNYQKAIDLLTEARDVLGLVVGEQKDEIARLRAEIERLKSGGSE